MALIVSFDTPQIRDCCSNQKVAEEKFGVAIARDIFTVMADVEAAENAQELLSIYDSSSKTVDDTLLIELGSTIRLSFTPVGTQISRDSRSNINWSSVRRLKLMGFEA